MVKILLKKQLTEIFRSYFYDAKKNKARSKAAITGYIVLFVILMVGILGGMFTFLSVSLCGALTAVGFDWLYFAIRGMLAIFLGAFGSGARLALFCNNGHYFYIARRFRQRVQYLFGALPRKG